MFVGVIVIILILIILPTILGLFFINTESTIGKAFIASFLYGISIEFAIFDIVALPMIFLKKSLSLTTTIYIILIIIVAILAFVFNFKKVVELAKKKKPKTKFSTMSFAMIVAVALIIFQITYVAVSEHTDADDATYVAASTTAIYTDTMFQYDEFTGVLRVQLEKRYAYYPLPIYIAMVSEISGIHPAVMAHTVWPIIFIVACYMLYYLFGTYIFKDNKKSTGVFLLFISLLNIWGNYSVYSPSSFLLFRLWQGKAMVANFTIPFIFMMFLILNKYKYTMKYWILLFVVLISGCMFSGMGVALGIMVCMALAVIFAVKEKNFYIILKSLVCCCLNILLGIIYVI